MERFGYDFNQKLALAQVSAYCGENVEQARACCHTSPSFERDLFIVKSFRHRQAVCGQDFLYYFSRSQSRCFHQGNG